MVSLLTVAKCLLGVHPGQADCLSWLPPRNVQELQALVQTFPSQTSMVGADAGNLGRQSQSPAPRKVQA